MGSAWLWLFVWLVGGLGVSQGTNILPVVDVLTDELALSMNLLSSFWNDLTEELEILQETGSYPMINFGEFLRIRLYKSLRNGLWPGQGNENIEDLQTQISTEAHAVMKSFLTKYGDASSNEFVPDQELPMYYARQLNKLPQKAITQELKPTYEALFGFSQLQSLSTSKAIFNKAFDAASFCPILGISTTTPPDKFVPDLKILRRILVNLQFATPLELGSMCAHRTTSGEIKAFFTPHNGRPLPLDGLDKSKNLSLAERCTLILGSDILESTKRVVDNDYPPPLEIYKSLFANPKGPSAMSVELKTISNGSSADVISEKKHEIRWGAFDFNDVKALLPNKPRKVEWNTLQNGKHSIVLYIADTSRDPSATVVNTPNYARGGRRRRKRQRVNAAH